MTSVRASGTYSEKLNVYVAGSDALWYMTFSGVSGSSKLSAIESTPGLSWYNVTAMKTTSWQTDFQVFGPSGYNLLATRSAPSQGLFLTVGSDSFADASAAASALDGYLLAAFVSASNGTGVYSFVSPVSYDSIVPATLLTFLPTANGGFAKAISPTTFDSTSSPMVVLEGVKSSSGFTHNLVVGSISPSALDSQDRPSVLGYFGATQGSLGASSNSSSSVISVYFLDGIVNASSSDKATVTSDRATFSGSYVLSLQPGKSIKGINASVVQRPAELLATRSVNSGVLRTGGNLSVTVTLTNLSPIAPISNLIFSDNWWNGTRVFSLVSPRNSTTLPTALNSGATVTPVYVLHYTGTSTGSMLIPASVVRYQYKVGSFTFSGQSTMNPVRLSLGTDDAVVYAYVSPIGGLGKPVGTQQKLNITVVNVGTQPASSVFVAGHSVSGLAASGGSAKVQISQTAASLVALNQTQSFQVTYQDSNGAHLNATTNTISSIFSHASMTLAFPSLVSTALVSFLPNGQTNLTLSFAVNNAGASNATSFLATSQVPAALGCGSTRGTGLTCTSGQLRLNITTLLRQTNSYSMSYNLASPQNFLIGPIHFQYSSGGMTFSGQSNPVAAPSGLRLSKAFSPSALFGGMSTQVSIQATNAGPFPFYNATFSSTGDSFDTVSGSSITSKSVRLLQPGGNVSFSYQVTAYETSGNHTSSKTVASPFFFGGTTYSISANGPNVFIYPPLSASITTSPASPTEGKSFTINIQVNNPSGVDVSNVQFKLPVPSGLTLSSLQNAQVSGGVLSVTAGALGAHGSVNASGAAVASSGILVPFNKATLTFTYNGVTVNGILPSKGIAVGEDVTTRYIIPTALVLLAVLAGAFYVRRLAAPSVPASTK